jgi:acyl carrier protein
MTPTDEIPAKLREILAQVLGAAQDGIGPGFSVESAPEWTSLNHLMLISQLESEFGVFFTNQEVQQLTSFDRILAALAGRNQIDS